MTESQKSKGISVSRIAIILLLSLILLLTAAILFFVISDNQVEGIMQVFKSDGEYTMALDEFIVNLKPEGSIRHYLKVSLALMYTDEDQGVVMESSINKIRDSIITSIRTRSYEEILEDAEAKIFKEDVKNSINDTLGQEAIKDIYITDFIIQ